MFLFIVSEAMINARSMMDEGIGGFHYESEGLRYFILVDFSKAIVNLRQFMKGYTEFDPKTKGADLRRLLFSNAIVGGIKFEDEQNWDDPSRRILSVFAQKGYGPFLYYAAATFPLEGKYSGYIGSDETVRPSARKVWKYFADAGTERVLKPEMEMGLWKDPETAIRKQFGDANYLGYLYKPQKVRLGAIMSEFAVGLQDFQEQAQDVHDKLVEKGLDASFTSKLLSSEIKNLIMLTSNELFAKFYAETGGAMW